MPNSSTRLQPALPKVPRPEPKALRAAYCGPAVRQRQSWQSSARTLHKHTEGEIILEKYRLIRVLGEGGMGSVWLARNLTLDVDVAIKLIRGDFAEPEAAWRLLQEAQAAARIDHPSIVRVFDFGSTPQGEPFIVMEVLQGESLGAVLDRKDRLGSVRAVRTMLPVASALGAAHDKGIIHRDLKPDNIVLVPNETGGLIPKIVDFGLAKLHRHDGATFMSTQRGVVLGSPGYMSPEQASGYMDVDCRTDVWAFCVVLYEALTGNCPFDGPNRNALLTAIIMNDPLPFKAYGIDDRVLWAILAKGLAKNAEERWRSMRELGTTLAWWLLEQGIETDVAGNSLAAHWTHVDEHRPVSSIMPPQPILPKAQPIVRNVPRISQVPTLTSPAGSAELTKAVAKQTKKCRSESSKGPAEYGNREGFASSLCPPKDEAEVQLRAGRVANRSRSAARFLVVATMTGTVLFAGNWIQTGKPLWSPSAALAPSGRIPANGLAALDHARNREAKPVHAPRKNVQSLPVPEGPEKTPAAPPRPAARSGAPAVPASRLRPSQSPSPVQSSAPTAMPASSSSLPSQAVHSDASASAASDSHPVAPAPPGARVTGPSVPPSPPGPREKIPAPMPVPAEPNF